MGYVEFKPELDGIDHINVYSKGITLLGRFLSNFSYSPIDTEDGRFNSIEGYWYWLGCKEESLRDLHGAEAKEKGRLYGGPDWMDTNTFKEKICKAIEIKLNTYPKYLKELQDTKLPLTHYYVYGKRVVKPKQGQWVIDFLKKMQEKY